MLRKIPTSKVCLGMYVHELCGSWMDHPFWQTQFLLVSPRDLNRLQESVVSEVWIDTAQGLDIADEGAVTEAQVHATSEAVLMDAAAVAMPVRRADLHEEIERARVICVRSRAAVVEMFSSVRMGQALDPGRADIMVEEIWQSIARHPDALISLVRIKGVDEYTYMHSVAVCALMISLGRQLGLDEATLREAGHAGLLHDVGKAGIPDAVLNKAGKLTDDEWRLMCAHPEVGARYLRETAGAGAAIIDACLHHHEKVDGTGYPHKLTGAEISLFAKMATVCDVYDAITSDRPYKSGWCPAEAVRKMAEWSRGHFDSRVFQAFVKTIGIYPVGSLVRLQSGRLGVVTEQNEESLLTPKVKIFYSARTASNLPVRVIDIARTGDKIVAGEDPGKWGFQNLDSL